MTGSYELVRTGVAAVPIDREFVRVSGKDAISFMQGQCTQDVVTLQVGSSKDSLILEPRGFIDCLVRLTRTGEEELLIDFDAGYADQVISRLERFKLRVKADIARLDWRSVSLRGPGARLVNDLPDEELALASDWPGLQGLDLLGPSTSVPEGVELVPAEVWNAVRIEAGIPRMGDEITEKTIPQETGLVDRCVSFTKGCFTGQELVARLDSRGGNVSRRLCGLVFESKDSKVLPGTELTNADQKGVGKVTSAAWSPGLDAFVALGYVHRSVDFGSQVIADGLAARVRDLPLVA